MVNEISILICFKFFFFRG